MTLAAHMPQVGHPWNSQGSPLLYCPGPNYLYPGSFIIHAVVLASVAREFCRWAVHHICERFLPCLDCQVFGVEAVPINMLQGGSGEGTC